MESIDTTHVNLNFQFVIVNMWEGEWILSRCIYRVLHVINALFGMDPGAYTIYPIALNYYEMRFICKY